MEGIYLYLTLVKYYKLQQLGLDAGYIVVLPLSNRVLCDFGHVTSREKSEHVLCENSVKSGNLCINV